MPTTAKQNLYACPLPESSAFRWTVGVFISSESHTKNALEWIPSIGKQLKNFVGSNRRCITILRGMEFKQIWESQTLSLIKVFQQFLTKYGWNTRRFEPTLKKQQRRWQRCQREGENEH